MKEVEVLVKSFKDLENYNKEITVKRNGKEIKIRGKLLLKGDIYSIPKARYEYLSGKGIVKEYKEIKTQNTKTDKADE